MSPTDGGRCDGRCIVGMGCIPLSLSLSLSLPSSVGSIWDGIDWELIQNRFFIGSNRFFYAIP